MVWLTIPHFFFYSGIGLHISLFEVIWVCWSHINNQNEQQTTNFKYILLYKETISILLFHTNKYMFINFDLLILLISAA